MLIKWSPELLTGNQIIDKQHIEIFDYVAQLVDSERTGKIESETGRILRILRIIILDISQLKRSFRKSINTRGMRRTRKCTKDSAISYPS